MSHERNNRPKLQAPYRFDVGGYHSVIGIYLAINAVPDTWLLVDSADCGTLRAELIHDNHDWGSTLITEDGRYRIANTGVCPHTVALDRNAELAGQMTAIGSGDGSFLFVYPPPVTAIVGLDYAVVARRVQAQLKMQVVPINPADTAGGDWLSGYAYVMGLLARHIQLPAAAKKRNKVALVGYLWDRNEGDNSGSVRELHRLLEGLGLEVCATWLSGTATADLARVAEASVIFELPHAGDAARILAERTGARLVPLHLPVGIESTLAWIDAAAEATARAKRGQALLRAEAAEAYDKVSKPVAMHFVGRDFAICTEPYLGLGLAGMVEEFGGYVRVLAFTGRARAPVPPAFLAAYLPDASITQVGDRVGSAASRSSRPLVLLSNIQVISTVGNAPVASVPIGFQAGGNHFLLDTPFVGIRGTYSLIDRIVAASTRAVMARAHAGPGGVFWNSPAHGG